MTTKPDNSKRWRMHVQQRTRDIETGSENTGVAKRETSMNYDLSVF